MGGKKQSKNINSNLINTSFDLKQFSNLENYGILIILENTCEFTKGKYQVGLLWKKDNPVLSYNTNLALKRS